MNNKNYFRSISIRSYSTNYSNMLHRIYSEDYFTIFDFYNKNEGKQFAPITI